MQNEEFYKAVIDAQNYFGVSLYLDLVFSDELNKYFNYTYCKEKDSVKINFQVEEGEATLLITDLTKNDIDYKLNTVMTNYLSKKRIEC